MLEVLYLQTTKPSPRPPRPSSRALILGDDTERLHRLECASGGASTSQRYPAQQSRSRKTVKEQVDAGTRPCDMGYGGTYDVLSATSGKVSSRCYEFGGVSTELRIVRLVKPQLSPRDASGRRTVSHDPRHL